MKRDMFKLCCLFFLIALMQLSCNTNYSSNESTDKENDTVVSKNNNEKATNVNNSESSKAQIVKPENLEYTHEQVNDCTIVLYQKNYHLKVILSLDSPLSSYATAIGYNKMKVRIKEKLIFSEMNIDDPGYYMFSLKDHEWPKLIKGTNFFYIICDKYYGEPEGSSYYGYKFNSDTLVKYVPEITNYEIPVDSLISLMNKK